MPFPPFAHPALADAPTDSAWSHFATTAFPGPSRDATTLAILPVHGFADHGLGLPLDIEEVIGASILRDAITHSADRVTARVLPPLRFGLTPYGPALGAPDPETLHALIREIALGVKTAGYSKLVFWSTSPWNAEIIDAASRDTRIELGLQTFVIELAGIGLNLHPASGDRTAAQSLGAALLGVAPAEVSNDQPVAPQDRRFRPGAWHSSPIVKFDPSIDPVAIRTTAVTSLANLLGEVDARAPLGSSEHGQFAPVEFAHMSLPPAVPWPQGVRSRYLPALTPADLQAISDKAAALVVIPVGAIEQHGPHLPVGVDAIIGAGAVAGLVQRLPVDAPIWIGPSVTYGKSNEHIDYPGTVSISARSLRRLLRVLVHDLHGHGFRQFAFLNTHGGNSAVLVYTLRELQTEFGVRAGMLRVASSPELSAQESTWGFHAGEWETSIMLTLTPDLVDMDKAICHYPAHLGDAGQLRPESAPAIYSWMTRDIASAGVMGDATAASPEKGQRWFAQAMDQLAAQVMGLTTPSQ